MHSKQILHEVRTAVERMLTALHSIYNHKSITNYLEHSSLQYGSSLASLTLPLHNTTTRSVRQKL